MLETLVTVLASVETQHAVLYAELVFAALPAAARAHIHEYLSEYAQKFVAQGETRGEARGKAGAVLAVLDARGIAVPNAARTRIGESDDPHQLEVWVRRAATANSVEDLFGEPRTAQH